MVNGIEIYREKKTGLYFLNSSREVIHSYLDSRKKILKSDLTRRCTYSLTRIVIFINFCFICRNLKKYCTYTSFVDGLSKSNFNF
ncbi:hypothetical protein QTP88_005082 [Uroleucon formosanum]